MWGLPAAASGVPIPESVFPRKRKSVLLGLAVTGIAIGLTVPNAIVPSQAASVLEGQTIRILAIGDPVFQVMQKIHNDMEKMAGGKIELEVRPFDVLHQQVLLNAQNPTSNYDIIAVDLPQFGEYRSFLLDLASAWQGRLRGSSARPKRRTRLPIRWLEFRYPNQP